MLSYLFNWNNFMKSNSNIIDDTNSKIGACKGEDFVALFSHKQAREKIDYFTFARRTMWLRNGCIQSS